MRLCQLSDKISRLSPMTNVMASGRQTTAAFALYIVYFPPMLGRLSRSRPSEPECLRGSWGWDLNFSSCRVVTVDSQLTWS